MVDRVLADAVLLLHLAFIVFVVVGGLLALRFRWSPVLHLPAAAWGVFVEATGRVCPLTPLENMLRRSAGDSGYAGSFVEHYVTSIVYPASLSRDWQLALAGVVIAVNALVYWLVWRKRRRGSRKPASWLRSAS